MPALSAPGIWSHNFGPQLTMILPPAGITMDDFVIQSPSKTTASTDPFKATPSSSFNDTTDRKVKRDDGRDATTKTLSGAPEQEGGEEQQNNEPAETRKNQGSDLLDHVGAKSTGFSSHLTPSLPQEEPSTTTNEKKQEPPAIPLPESFEPTPYTIIIGRHSEAKTNLGNKRLQILASNYLSDYSAAQNRRIKTAIVNEIQETILKANGMFIVKNKTDKRWYHASDAVAREKIGYVLRDLLSHMYRSSSRSKVERKKRLRRTEEGAASITTTSSSMHELVTPSSPLWFGTMSDDDHDTTTGSRTTVQGQEELTIPSFSSKGGGGTSTGGCNALHDTIMDADNDTKNPPTTPKDAKTMEIFGRVVRAPACSSTSMTTQQVFDDEPTSMLPRPREISFPSTSSMTPRGEDTGTATTPGSGRQGAYYADVFGGEFSLEEQHEKQMMNMNHDLHPWIQRNKGAVVGPDQKPSEYHHGFPQTTAHHDKKTRRKDSFDVEELLHTGLLPTNGTSMAAATASSSTARGRGGGDKNSMSHHAAELLFQASNLMLLSDDDDDGNYGDMADQDDTGDGE